MPIISVVIPVFNGEKTIKETIESVLNQTFRDFKLIVINDGSQDSTLQIVDSIKDHRLQVFSYSNAGLSASRNRGIYHAVGEYISFIDADDLWTPDKLEAQFKALQANPHAGVAYSWTDYIDESSQFFRQGAHFNFTGNIYAKLLVTNLLENGSNPLIRTQAFTEVGGFDESLSAAEDWDMWLRLASRYHFVVVPSPQILYRVSVNSMSSKLDKQEAESLKVIEKAFNQAPESVKHLKKASLANLYKYLIFKALEDSPERDRGLISVRFLLLIISNYPALLRTRIIWKVLFKIVTITLLPPQQAQALLTKMKGFSNIDALHVHIRLEPS
jgi:glycosyltransferase involved in cell wall biosynthesis